MEVIYNITVDTNHHRFRHQDLAGEEIPTRLLCSSRVLTLESIMLWNKNVEFMKEMYWYSIDILCLSETMVREWRCVQNDLQQK